MSTKKLNRVVSLVLTVSDKLVALLNGFLEAFLQEGREVLILRVGEEKHQWSKSIEGPAFQAVDINTGDFGWVSPNSLKEGIAYQEQPSSFIWEETTPKEGQSDVWYVCKDAANTSYEAFGLATAGLPQAFDLNTNQLIAAVYVKVDARKKAWASTPLAANTAAAQKMRSTVVHKKPSSKTNGFTCNCRYWLGSARWATAADVDKIPGISDEEKTAILTMLK